MFTIIRKIFPIFYVIFFANISHGKTIHDFILDKPVKFVDLEFFDENKKKYKISDFKGNVVMLNIWATWCKPCVDEMPLINKLQEKVVGEKVKIIPLSMDFAGVDIVQKFYDEYNLDNLKIYHDTNELAFKELKLKALPTTIILNKKGEKIAEILGESDWSSDEMRDYLINPHKNLGGSFFGFFKRILWGN